MLSGSSNEAAEQRAAAEQLTRDEASHAAAEVLLAQLLEVEGRMAIRSLRDLQASDFASMTRRYGIEIVAEKIEADETAREAALREALAKQFPDVFAAEGDVISGGNFHAEPVALAADDVRRYVTGELLTE